MSKSIVKPGPKTSWPFLNLNKYNTQKATHSSSYYFKDSNVHLVQANESLDEDFDEFEKKESTPIRSNISKKLSPKSNYGSDKSSLVEIYTPRSIKCYNISNESWNGEREDADMLLEMKFPDTKSKADLIRLPISLTCDNRIKNPVARTVLNSFNLLQSKYSK